MTIDFEGFLHIANTLNITRAAEQMHVSQQRLSSYLQRLESTLGVTLFFRKPKLALTPAGHIFLEYALRMDSLTAGLYRELDAYKADQKTSITIGMSFGRAQHLLARLLAEFYRCYGNEYYINTIFATTVEMYDLVQNGKIDIALGVNAFPRPGIEQLELYQENMLLALSERSLKHFFPEEYPNCKDQFCCGADLKRFENIPFLFSAQNSHSYQAIHKYITEKGIELNPVGIIDSSEVHLELVQTEYLACIFSTLLKDKLSLLNSMSDDNHKINAFPIKDFVYTQRISLLISETGNRSPAVEKIIEIFKSIAKEYHQLGIL